LQGLGVGPGDEVFMVGRFVSREGKEKNTPAVRFGSLAMVPRESFGEEQVSSGEHFLVNCRSIFGYSGSPVFVFIDPTLPRPPYWFTPAMPVYNAKLQFAPITAASDCEGLYRQMIGNLAYQNSQHPVDALIRHVDFPSINAKASKMAASVALPRCQR
jgi:hypothetical protein